MVGNDEGTKNSGWGEKKRRLVARPRCPKSKSETDGLERGGGQGGGRRMAGDQNIPSPWGKRGDKGKLQWGEHTKRGFGTGGVPAGTGESRRHAGK